MRRPTWIRGNGATAFDRARASGPLWLVLALASAAIVSPFHPPIQTREAAYGFEARVGCSARGAIRLYYDTGRGFNDGDSAAAPVGGGAAPELVKLPLPAGRYGELRLDLEDYKGSVTISGALIRDDTGRVVRRFPASAFKGAEQAGMIPGDESALTIKAVPGARGPSTPIHIGPPLVLSERQAKGSIQFLEWSVAAYLVLGAGVVIGSRMPWGRAASALKGAARRPKAVIGLAALVALLANSYPVIFFGKSFVSPNNGVFLLYHNFPTLPQFKSTHMENGKGSDVGAVMWWHVPISRIQQKALLRDHELPLWNRYDLCGQSLLGQGQSMIGDPLHLLTAVLGGGSAAAWDVKYLAAKWLFAFGLGLIVFALTNRLAVAALLSASSLFIGFFAFRLNHPAIFSLCYAPWILYSWIRIAGAPSRANAAAWTAALLVSDWVEINSGTVKEAYVLVIWLNLAGLLALLLNRDGRPLKLQKLLAVGWASILFVLVSSPLWLTFLDTLKGSMTSYDVPDAWQIPASRAAGFFEDLFYRQSTAEETHVAPSANFLILLGVLWAIAHVRRLSANRAFLALGLSALIPVLLVYGGIPKAAIVAVPFLRNIRHIDNTFSCVLIVLATPLAGFGLQSCLGSLRARDWPIHFGAVLLLLGALLGVYFGLDRHLSPSAFFMGYVPSLVLALLILQLASRHLAGENPNRACAVILVGIALLALHWRHGQYLQTAFDDYVFNPQERANLRADSPSIRFTEGQKATPSRTLGLALNLFPGFNGMYLVEGVLGIDALRSQEYEDLAWGLGLERIVLWSSIQGNESSDELRAAYDALNVSYFLGSKGSSPGGISGWKKVKDLDLTVYKSPSSWPRAFFVDRVTQYADLRELVAQIRTAQGRPFAGLQATDLPDLAQLGSLPADPRGRRVVAAGNYTLTSNTTSFSVDAPCPGVVVLSETWLRDDFQVTVNGRPVPYFRVNHAFKGVYLESAGSYRIEFRYWPRFLTPALWASASGVILACGSYLAARRAHGA